MLQNLPLLFDLHMEATAGIKHGHGSTDGLPVSVQVAFMRLLCLHGPRSQRHLSHNITLIHPKLVDKFSFQEIQDVSSWASNWHRSNIKASQVWHGSCLVEPWTPPGMQPPASLSLSSCVWPPQDEGFSLHLPGTFLAAVPATASCPSSIPQEAPGSSPQGAEGGRRILQPSPGLHKPTSQTLLTQSHAPASVL